MGEMVTIREGREGDGKTYEICIPHADYVLDANFAHEQAIHPSETKLDEFNAFLL